MLPIILVFVIIGIGFVAYWLGHNNGFSDGYESGFVAGKTEGIQIWQRTLETKRLGPNGKDGFLGVRR